MAVQLAVGFSESTLDDLDRLISVGVYANRAEAIRAAVDILVRDARRSAIDRAVVGGYRSIPDQEEDAWLEEATRALVRGGPW